MIFFALLRMKEPSSLRVDIYLDAKYHFYAQLFIWYNKLLAKTLLL